LPQPHGQRAVLPARRRVTRRVVVNEHAAGRRHADQRAKHLARVDLDVRDAAARDLDDVEQPAANVDADRDEDFLGQAREPGRDTAIDILGAQLREPRLSAALSDYTTPADGRIALLDKVLEGSGIDGTAAALLSQTIGHLRGERADEAVLDLAELAVARRGELVAHVVAAAELTDAQRTRLTEVLSRIYGHPVSIQLHVDPELLGGLSITVGDEVIDGSIASRLSAAQTQLPD